MGVKQAAEPIALHGPFTHLGAHHNGTAPGARGPGPIARGKKGGHLIKQAQKDQLALVATPLPIDAVKGPMAAESVLLGQGQRLGPGTDRQAGTAPATAGADHAAAGVGPHPHPET